MLAAIRRILRNEDDAREALQDAFISAFRSIERFAGSSGLGTWLHRIAVNAALMKLRGKRRRPELALEELLPRFDAGGHACEPPAPWPDDAIELASRRELSSMLRELIDQLPENHRDALLLRDLEEIPTDEVATLLGITQNAVKIRVRREFDRHLAACPSCIRYLEGYKSTLQLARQAHRDGGTPDCGMPAPGSRGARDASGETAAPTDAVPEELIQAILAARRRETRRP